MSILGKIIHIHGISHKGKNRVKANGHQWIVLAYTDVVLFAPGVTGPWIFITPIGKDQNDKSAQWMKLNNDDNFSIIVD